MRSRKLYKNGKPVVAQKDLYKVPSVEKHSGKASIVRKNSYADSYTISDQSNKPQMVAYGRAKHTIKNKPKRAKKICKRAKTNNKRGRKFIKILNKVSKRRMKNIFDILKLQGGNSNMAIISNRSISISPDKELSLNRIINPLQLTMYKPNSIASYFTYEIRPSPTASPRPKIDSVTYRKHVQKGLKIISNVLSRVVLCRK